MKKRKLENELLLRDIERIQEQLLKKKIQITKNNILLKNWQNEVNLR